MTEWEATRHLGFGSATVLKKLVGGWLQGPGRAAVMRAGEGGCRSRGGRLRLLARARRALRVLLDSPRHPPGRSPPPPRPPPQVLPRLGMKVWPYRKRVTMRGIREQLEVRAPAGVWRGPAAREPALGAPPLLGAWPPLP